VFCNSFINGEAFTLSQPISTVFFISFISFFIFVKNEIFSSKASSPGFLVYTPSKILRAIHSKLSSSSSSPSLFNLTCFYSLGSIPVFKNASKFY
jgi:hypothetical protein